MWILVKKCVEMQPIYRQKYRKKLKPFVWRCEGCFELPETVSNEKELTKFLHSAVGTGMFMIMVWHKHRKKSPYYSTDYKMHTPRFFNGMIIGINSSHNGAIYKNKIQKRLQQQNPEWKEKTENWQEEKETWQEQY